MEVEETTLPVVQSSDENIAKKGKILTLLFPPEAVPVEGRDAKKDKNKPLTKVVVRRLPPRLTKEGFLEEFSPLPPHDYFHFVRGDLSLGIHSFSRAYINFTNQEDIFTFKEKYDDYGLQDEKGKTYHAVVEFAPFQRVPRRNALKKKLSKAGTLESDPKYLEFLKKLEEYKNNATNTSEYFYETENSTSKEKITTTPLLEYLKAKRQKKNDFKNDLRARKREQEKERKRKEEEKRKAERERRKEEKKNSRYDDKSKGLDDKSRKSDERLKENRKNEIRGRSKEDKRDVKNWKAIEGYTLADDKSDVVIPTDPAILQVVIRHPEKSTDRNGKSTGKILSASNEENRLIKNTDSESSLMKNEKKYSDFRTRLAEEKQRKTFHKRDSDDSKTLKAGPRSRKGVPDERGDNYTVGNCSEGRDCGGKKSETDLDGTRKHDSKVEQKEAKSKFRYSEQRNREREYRNQKASDWKKDGVSGGNGTGKGKGESGRGEKDEGKGAEEPKSSGAEAVQNGSGKEGEESASEGREKGAVKCRRRSLELEKKLVEEVRKRSRSFHDLSSKKLCDLRMEKRSTKGDSDREGNLTGTESETTQLDDGSKESTESEKADDESKKEARAERRIRNKDRPSIEIYRPGMGKFSRQRLEQKKEETTGGNQGSAANSIKNNRIPNKANNKKPSMRNDSVEHKLPMKVEKGEEPSGKSNSSLTKTPSEVRTMTFTRSGSKEN